MIKIHITPDDISELRFAYSPLLELVTSYGSLYKPGHQSAHHRWTDEAMTALQGAEFSHMDALMLAKGYIPDFITPTPTDPRPTLERELELVAATPHDLVRKNIQELVDNDGDSS